MSRTVKWEHPSDTDRIGKRLERKARSAGRLKELVEFEWDSYRDNVKEFPITYVPAGEECDEEPPAWVDAVLDEEGRWR